MSYNGSGVYSLPGAQLANGQIVSATENNEFRNDVASALNTAWTRDGQAPATDDIPMGNNKLTGLAAPTVAGDALAFGAAATVGNLSVTGAATISGAVICDNLSPSGDLEFTGIGKRITGDFSSSELDLTDRVLIQTNVVGGDTKFGLIPNGAAGNATVFQLRTYDPDAVGTNGNLSVWGCSEDVGYTFLNTGQEGTGTPHPFVFGVNGIEFMRANIVGEVQIHGTTDQGAYNLQVNGTGVWAAGAYVNGSDERLKENIADIDSCLDVVNSLRPVTFNYKKDYSKDQNVQPGFIAQELQESLSGKNYLDGVVQKGPRYLNVAYQNLIPVLTKAIQEQQEQISQLRAELDALKGA